jgi:hypothetical protein
MIKIEDVGIERIKEIDAINLKRRIKIETR